jgi:hypothetical protein
MGGFGSGRPEGGGRSLVEHSRSLNVDRLQRTGCLAPGWSGLWQWTQDGERVAWIGIIAAAGHLRLVYRVRSQGSDWREVEETIPIEQVRCPFGGTRPYFRCPGVFNGIPCGDRVAKLFLATHWFLCRRCSRLAYASQRETGLDRTLRRANKIRCRLGGEAGLAARFPERPKGMWWRTYDRLRWRVFEAEMAAEESIEARLAGLGQRLARRQAKRRKAG